MYLETSGDFILFLKGIHINILGLDGSAFPPIEADSPVMHNTIRLSDMQIDEETGYQETFVTGTFYSKEETISAEGVKIMEREAAMDKIYPILFKYNYSKNYIGLETDSLIHIYPGGKYTVEYDPTVREWYYRAANATDKIIVMEPYIGAQRKDHIFTISTAIMHEGKVYGVVASDISLTKISENVNNLDNEDIRFMLLISKGGKILAQPKSWNSLGKGLRIFDTDITGIDASVWRDIKDTDIAEDYMGEFKDLNGTDYYYVRISVNPEIGEEEINTHYLLFCVKKDTIYEPLERIESKFDETYEAVFWEVFVGAIATLILITIFVLKYLRRICDQLYNIDRILNQIVNMGLFPDLTKDINTQTIEENNKEIKGLSGACLLRLTAIKKSEVKYESFEWGETRPKDYIIVDNWRNKIYPNNYYANHTLPWNTELSKLGKKSKPKNKI